MSTQASQPALNAGDANPPSRPGPITSIAFLLVVGVVVVAANWSKVKGFVGVG